MQQKRLIEEGFSLLELVVILTLIGLFLLVSTTNLSGAHRQRDFENFAKEMVAMLETCRWKALNERRYAGILVEEKEGGYVASLYVDGNNNGIRIADIRSGVEQQFHSVIRLDREGRDIAPGILVQPVQQIPPRKGLLEGDDPIRFGKSDIISFSPRGDSSSGTMYLACRSQAQMYAVVLYGATARINLWKLSNHEWQMVGDR